MYGLSVLQSPLVVVTQSPPISTPELTSCDDRFVCLLDLETCNPCFMSPFKKNLKPKQPRRRKVRPPWQEQVNPALVDWWRAKKENRKLREISDEKEAEHAFHRNFQSMNAAQYQLLHEPRRPDSIAASVWSAILSPLDGEVCPWPISAPNIKLRDSYAQNPEANSIFRTLVFLEHGITFRDLATRAETDQEAPDVLLRVHRDWYRLRWEGRSFEAMRLKFALDHFQIILDGIDYGLNKLNETELAKCLDDICPCGRWKHSAEYLKKLKLEIVKACRDLVAGRQSPMESR
jgi:hypothetical protein